MVHLQRDPFLTDLTSMYERNKEKGSVWVTLKRSSMKSKAKLKKMEIQGKAIEYRCLVRATDGKKTICTSLSAKDHQKFQTSYAIVLRAHMSALKNSERNGQKRASDVEQKPGSSKKPTSSS